MCTWFSVGCQGPYAGCEEDQRKTSDTVPRTYWRCQRVGRTGFVSQIIADNPDAVADYCSGKEAALKYLVGQVMRHSRGQANPQQASELLVAALSG